MKRIIVGITGATGVVYGIRLLEVLRELGVESHLILSDSAKKNIAIETAFTVASVEKLAHTVHDNKNMAASISSGSFKTDGMIIAPCTIKTLSGVAYSYNDTLLIRAADVVLKERRRLILLIRETPLHKGHLEMLVRIADLGGIILPPIPAFYQHPKNIEDIINHSIGKILDLLDMEHNLYKRWEGEDL
ncbi:MAG: UbiX family flavin prenyltransferase [Syntrophaceae bacterium]|nr:UbiX family flavin prenyltransferase [Syntrophaceae bacterium]